MTPTLTRRDAVAALVAGGVGGSALLAAEGTTDPDGSGGEELTEAALSTLVALAEVVYPSAVEGTDEFVRTYAGSLPGERRAAMAESARRLDDGARRYAGSDFADLPPAEREAVLGRMGVDTVQSAPEGSPPARIRYHLVNSLLYALFTSPTGSELLGIENPTGYPGGYESQTRPPAVESRIRPPDEQGQDGPQGGDDG